MVVNNSNQVITERQDAIAWLLQHEDPTAQLASLLRRTKDVAHLVGSRLMPAQGACGAADYRSLCASLDALSSVRCVLQDDNDATAAAQHLPSALQRIGSCLGEPLSDCMQRVVAQKHSSSSNMYAQASSFLRVCWTLTPLCQWCRAPRGM